MSSKLMNQYLSGLLLIILGSPALAESILEYHQRQCAAGKESSCQRAQVMQAADEQATRIEKLGDAFAARVNRDALETDNKPELDAAYLLVMKDFFDAEAEHGIQQRVNNDMLQLCADHYHDYWRNRKLIWPTDEQQRPDWSAIYYYIVDHYYGYCTRSFLSGANNS